MVDFRRLASSALDGRFSERLAEFAERDWLASAIVFAPHPDDETLGCGGVVSKKIAAGADVGVVFVTDGAASHASKVAPDALRVMREAEGVEAVVRLGGSAENVTFLRFSDGRATQHVGEIADAVVPLLRTRSPQSVFIPHAKDPPPDHIAVNQGVGLALARHGRPVTVFEYPVWYWYHWPWVRLGGDLPRMWRTTLRQSLKTGAGLRGPSTLNVRAYVGDVLARKRDALAAHVSQMQRPADVEDWATLSDLAGGDFLARLMNDYEMFTRYQVNA